MPTLPGTVFPETAPIPLIKGSQRGGIRKTLAVRAFRSVFVATLSSSAGAWFSRVALDWMILELTGSVAAVGLAVTFQFAPTLVLGLWGGVLTDYWPRLRVLRIANGIILLAAILLATLAQFGVLSLWVIYAAAALTGLGSAAEVPARSALVAQVVPAERLQTAIGINATAFHAAALVCVSASALVVAVWGAAWALTIAAVLSLCAAMALTTVRSADIPPTRRSSSDRGGALLATAAYVWRKPGIRWPMVLIAFVSTFGMTHNVLYVAAAGSTGFGTGPEGYGLYMAVGAFGAMAGALLSTLRRTVTIAGVVTAAILFGLVMAATALTHTVPTFICAVLGASVLRITFATGSEALVQLSTNPALRGRVAALYFVIVAAGQTAGAVLVGSVAQVWGLNSAFAVAGGMPLLAACIVMILSARSWHVRVMIDIRSFRRPIRLEPRNQSVVNVADAPR
ncbi:MAG: MFS transporter [Microbacterium sp.]